LSAAYTVVYDGTCNVCTKFIDALTKLDRQHQLEILPSQTAGLAMRFAWIPDHAYSESIQVIRRADGRTWQGAAAIEQLLDALPKGGMVSWIFRVPFMRPIAERFYRWFARKRYKFGCNEHCRVDDR
jgi:predicted DCC family thiol-disulfide oxidoreductase YuxK